MTTLAFTLSSSYRPGLGRENTGANKKKVFRYINGLQELFYQGQSSYVEKITATGYIMYSHKFLDLTTNKYLSSPHRSPSH